MFGVTRAVKTTIGAVKGGISASRSGGNVAAGAAAGGAKAFVEGGRFIKRVPGLADKAAGWAHDAVASRAGGARQNHFNDGHQGAVNHSNDFSDW